MAVGPLAQVHISVTDLDRSVAFYRDTLGIPLLFQVPGRPMAFMDSGQVRLYLGVPERPEFRTKVLVYFAVDDVEAEQDRLAGLGCEFGGRPHLTHSDGTTELWMSFTTDPDGHHVALIEERPVSRP
jgi:catechol 2,3-dioxygenase-like lactoylglutathione lyase family enzyme